MWNEEKFQEFEQAMKGDSISQKVIWFQELSKSPSDDDRVLPFLETSMEDSTICLIGAPLLYAELRLTAALAFARELNQPVPLYQSVGWLYGEGYNANVYDIFAQNEAYLKTHYQYTVGEPYHTEKQLNFLRHAGLIELKDYLVFCTKNGASALLPLAKPNP
jgi:hypothetical protein